MDGRLVIAAAVTVVALFVVLGRNRTFRWDEWGVLLQRHSGVEPLFTAIGGHLSAVPILGYRGLMRTAGLDNYTVFWIAGVLAHLACAGLLLRYLSARLRPTAALVLTLIFAVWGYVWQVVLWPWTALLFAVPVAAFLLSLEVLDGGRPWGPWVAALALSVGVGSSALGVPLALAVAVHLVVRRDLRRAWVVVVPLAGYAAWWLGVGDPFQIQATAAPSPLFILEGIAALVGGPRDLPLPVLRSVVGGVVALGLLVALIARLRSAPDLLRRIAAPAAAFAGFWGLAAIGRSDLFDASSSRYLYAPTVLAVMIGAEAVAGRTASTWTKRAMPVAAVVCPRRLRRAPGLRERTDCRGVGPDPGPARRAGAGRGALPGSYSPTPAYCFVGRLLRVVDQSVRRRAALGDDGRRVASVRRRIACFQRAGLHRESPGTSRGPSRRRRLLRPRAPLERGDQTSSVTPRGGRADRRAPVHGSRAPSVSRPRGREPSGGAHRPRIRAGGRRRRSVDDRLVLADRRPGPARSVGVDPPHRDRRADHPVRDRGVRFVRT